MQSRSETPQGLWRRVEWTYDAFGRRIRQRTLVWTNSAWVVIEDLKFISDPMLFGRHIVELNATDNTLMRSYVWGLDLSETLEGAGGVGGLLWVTLHTASGPAAGTQFATYDGNGNVVALVSASTGTEIARYEYGPFAEPIRLTGPAATLNPFRFSTKRTCNTSDLVLYEYRAYSPTLGRWLSRDPVASHRGEPIRDVKLKDRSIASEPLYVFCLNDPLAGVDALGLYDVRVKKCHVIVLCGHGSASKPHNFEFLHDCSAGHFVGCYSRYTNERIPEKHRIPGAPSADGPLYWTPHEGLDREEDGHWHFEETWKAAVQLANSLCKKADCSCCRYIYVRTKVAGSWFDWMTSPCPSKSQKVPCR